MKKIVRKCNGIALEIIFKLSEKLFQILLALFSTEIGGNFVLTVCVRLFRYQTLILGLGLAREIRE